MDLKDAVNKLNAFDADMARENIFATVFPEFSKDGLKAIWMAYSWAGKNITSLVHNLKQMKKDKLIEKLIEYIENEY